MTRSQDALNFWPSIKVHRPLTAAENKALRWDITTAVHEKRIDTIVDALSVGWNVNSYSVHYSSDHYKPMINLAAETGFTEAVKFLLEMGANPHLDKSQDSALCCAAYGGVPACVELCFNHEDQTGSRHSKEEYNSAFHMAMVGGGAMALDTLLKRRGDQFDCEDRWTADGFAEAARHGHLEVIQLLTSCRLFTRVKKTRALMLHNAIKNKRLETLGFLLVDAKVNPNELNDVNEHPLFTVMDCHQVDDEEARNHMISVLIKAGASPNGDSPNVQMTPLHASVLYNLFSTAELLLKHGADPTRDNCRNENVLEFAIRRDYPKLIDLLSEVKVSDPVISDRYFGKGLLLATKKGDRDIALRMIGKGDIDIMDLVTGRTPLLEAIVANHLPMAPMLVRNGARADMKDNEGSNAVALAASQGMHLLIKDLVKAKQSPGLEVSDSKGFSPLMLACKAGHEDAVRVLLGLGADRDAMNKYGETALDIAEEARFQKIIELLETV